jgi:AP-3 complex subunit delta
VTDYNLQSIVQRLLAHLVPSQESATSALPSAAQSLTRTAAAATSDMSLAIPVTHADASPTPSTLTSAYRLEVCQRIITMCSRDAHENVTDFEWYLSVLVDLAYVSNVGSIGRDINDKLLDVVVRVRGVRTFAVGLMLRLLSDEILLENCRDPTSCSEVLWAAAWICGEYCSYVSISFALVLGLPFFLRVHSHYRDRELASPQELAPLLLQPNVMLLPEETIAVYLQSALKIFGHWAAEVSKHWDEGLLPEIKDQVDKMISNLDRFTTSSHIEVQERVSFSLP